MNKPKAKGTAAETAVVKYMRDNGFPGADRQPLRGNRDAGDIALCPGIVLEIKSHATAATGQPGPTLLDTWIIQAEAERINAGAAHCPLIVKRKGAGDANVGAWFSYLPAGHLATLIGAHPDFHAAPFPVCMSVAALTMLLRGAGYGTPSIPAVGVDPMRAVAS